MLSDQAMISTIEIKVWSARSYDDKVSSEIAASKGTEKSAGRYTKQLMPGNTQLRVIGEKLRELRSYHYANTLPWQWKGGQLLPGSHFKEYTKKIADLVQDFDDAVDVFVDPDNYAQAIKDAQGSLGAMFDPTLYPPVGGIKHHFYASVSYTPCPSEGDFRVDCQQEEIDALKAAWRAKEVEITNDATSHLWEKLSGLMAHAQERLNDPDNVFRDTLPKNIKDFTSILSKMNIGEDCALDQLGKEAAVIGNIDPQELRDDPQLRADTADHAKTTLDKIKRQMGAFHA